MIVGGGAGADVKGADVDRGVGLNIAAFVSSSMDCCELDCLPINNTKINH